jgi:hypothetical protein
MPSITKPCCCSAAPWWRRRLFKRLGLGTVLGYTAAGIVIGPVSR